MFVQLDIHYYVGITSFRELPYIYMVSSTEPDEPLKCFLFTSVAVLVVLTDFIEYILFGVFCFVLFFLLLTGLKVLDFRNLKSRCKAHM